MLIRHLIVLAVANNNALWYMYSSPQSGCFSIGSCTGHRLDKLGKLRRRCSSSHSTIGTHQQARSTHGTMVQDGLQESLMISCSGWSRPDVVELGYISTTCSFLPSYLFISDKHTPAVQLILSAYRITLLLTIAVLDQHGGT